MLESLLQDIRYAGRWLTQSPGFTAVAVLSLALGISANSVIFSVISRVMFGPLPYQEAERLVAILETLPAKGQFELGTATANLVDYRTQSRSFEQMQLISGGPITGTLSQDGRSEYVGTQYVTPGFFEFLGLRPAVGSLFPKTAGLQGTVVLSHAFWKRRYGADPKVLGQTLLLEGRGHTVVGVVAPGFRFSRRGDEIDVWYPIDLDSPDWINRNVHWLFAVGRLKPGVSIERAQAEMETVAWQLGQSYPDTNQGRGVRLLPLQELFVGRYRKILYPLFGAVGLVLLVACTNIANLLLARASSRQKEVAIRLSLGAKRNRLIRQMLTESLLLALLGGLCGLSLVSWGMRLLMTIAPEWFVHVKTVDLNWSVVVFTLLLSLFTGVAFGLAPALHASRVNLFELLKEGGKNSTSLSRYRTLTSLVVMEIAVAMMLVVGAGLLMKTFLYLQEVEPGFSSQNLLTMNIKLSGAKYVEPAPRTTTDMSRITPQLGQFYSELVERIGLLPGVSSAAIIDWMPMSFSEANPLYAFAILGRANPPAGERLLAGYNAVSPGYFMTMQIPILRGRDFSKQDLGTTPWVIVINEIMARQYWPDSGALGERIRLELGDGELPREVVGIVGNVRRQSLSIEPKPEMYVSYLQQPEIYPGSRKNSRLHKNLIIKTQNASPVLIEAVRNVVSEIDQNQLVYGIRSMDELVSESASSSRFYMRLLGVLAAVAMILAAMGIYGVISYSVQERTREIGIRMALGGQRNHIIKLVVGQGLTLALFGVVAGVLGALVLTRFLASLLYGVGSTDPVTFLLTSVLLALVALLACYIPAKRASRTDPIIALRHD